MQLPTRSTRTDTLFPYTTPFRSHSDTAQMVNNSRQGAVFVTFGGPNRRAPALAFKIDRPFTGGEEIRAAGRNRILLTIPDVSEHLLFMDRIGPKVINFGE